jgi:regulator of extracellular matrix RemA (YlzA/DUF370 family)
MSSKLVNIGFGSVIFINRIVALIGPESAQAKRIIQEAKYRGKLINATHGRKTKAVVITDSEHVILSAVLLETIVNRLPLKEEDKIQNIFNS